MPKRKWRVLAITLLGVGGILLYCEVKRVEKAEIEEAEKRDVRLFKKSCLETLATIERIKIDLVRYHNKKIGYVVTKDDLDAGSGSGGFIGKCITGGEYTINPIGKHAECSIPDHKLPANWTENDNLP